MILLSVLPSRARWPVSPPPGQASRVASFLGKRGAKNAP